MDTKDDRDRGDKSDSTEPLITDSYSGDEDIEAFERSIDDEEAAIFKRENLTT